ncbi:hypothetical protein [Streptomyces sp. NPDC058086]|uniref:hypothetical protein n=1 Tax=Streptomyces sp. NPDC058086 TaxID=3346334 RepID=UPI0036F129A5
MPVHRSGTPHRLRLLAPGTLLAAFSLLCAPPSSSAADTPARGSARMGFQATDVG